MDEKQLGINATISIALAFPDGQGGWRRVPGKLVVSEGFLDQVEAEGEQLSYTHGQTGANITIHIFDAGGRILRQVYVDGVMVRTEEVAKWQP